ncbi:MAG: phosphoglucomutase/phosphomannomutase family protein [Candidatus Firestonebacteria bacterium]
MDCKIKFGTSGWRGVISDDFTFNNVRKVSQAIANYVLEKDASSGTRVNNGIIIGYDTRFLSEEFAKVAAQVLSSNGIKVLLTKRDVPTPVIAYEIIRRKLAGGINITASHNPPEYNGLKFSPSWGGPALPETTKIIENYANNKNLIIKSNLKSEIKKINPRMNYIKNIEEKVDLTLIKKSKLKVGVDCLYGTGRDYLDYILKKIADKVVVLHNQRDVYFGGSSPEPSEENLKELINIMKEKKPHIGLAVDGDADRFGIIDRDGTFISPNEVLSLLLVYLKKTRGWKGCVVRTVATTHFIDALGKKYNIPVKETPVGFKYIGEIMLKEDMIIGGEESGGLTIYKHIPEKDGILACLLMLEMVAYEKKSISEILKNLYKEVGFFINTRINIKLSEDKKKKLIDILKNNPPSKFSEFEVGKLITIDGYKFLFKDGSWIMIRLSGTEPLVRCYAESNSKKKLHRIIKIGKKFILSV